MARFLALPSIIVHTANDRSRSKGKRGRKRKIPPEAGVLEPKAKVACVSHAAEPVGHPVVVWTSEEQIAPVARMV
jgi:hypothetical protein